MKKNKIIILKRITLFFLLTFLNIFLLVGLTYFFSVLNYYKNFEKANHSFRVLYLNLDENVDKRKLLKKISNNEHVLDIFSYDEYMSFGTVEEYKSNLFTGEINLIGVNPGMQKIIAGSDLKENELSMICPKDLYPEIYYDENPYNYNLNLNIINDLNRVLNLKYVNEKNGSIKLVGIFDRSYDYTDPNVCYVTHETLRKLNDMTYESSDNDIKDIYVLIDDLNNINDLYNYSEILDIIPITRLKTENLTSILSAISIVTSILIIFITFNCYLFTNRQIINDYRNIGIYRIIGYSKKYIKKKYYFEDIVIIVSSLLFSIMFSNIILSKFVQLFLYNKPQLSMINMSLSLNIIFISIFVITISVFLSTFISLKKIDNMDIGEIINE